jgi:hypothetical protein
MITWNQDEQNALKGRFISRSISEYITKNVVDRHIYKSPLLFFTTYIFNDSNLEEVDSFRNIMIERALDFQNRTNNKKNCMVIYWFPTMFKKEFPTDKNSLDVEEINSATTFHYPNNPFISIYRLEEAPKVLYHELSHFFKLDDILSYYDDDDYTRKFNLKVPCLLCETYSELLAFFLNLEDISKRTGDDFLELYTIEYTFSILQTQKILDFYNVSNDSQFDRIKSNTNVFTYFILKTAILKTISDPLLFLKEREKYDFKLHSSDYLKNCINEGLHLLFDEKIPKIPEELKKTLRMTIIE